MGDTAFSVVGLLSVPLKYACVALLPAALSPPITGTLRRLLILVGSLWMMVSFAAPVPPLNRGPQKVHFQYELTVPPSETSGKKLRIWIPYPHENETQTILSFKHHSPWPLKLTQEKTFGNRIIYIEGKSSQKPVRLTFDYDIIRHPDQGMRVLDEWTAPSRYLKPHKRVPLFDEARKIAADLVKHKKNDFEKIRSLYDYVVDSMNYNKEGTGWGEGDAVWACSTKRGNCTDFHSLLMALALTQHVPARFEIGVPLPQEPGVIPGYHCWLQLYDPKKGWIPMDTTEAKKTNQREAYFGRLPSNRILLSRGRDIVLTPPQQGEPLNFFFYPYSELDNKPYRNIQTAFSFKRSRP